jgi:hypothetical protein
MNNDTPTQSEYLFAQGTDETRRPKRQAEFLSRFTCSLLDAARIRSGMKVLDGVDHHRRRPGVGRP